ncbi:MAG: helix-turn-helix domain-containing protein [Anaerolineae bacterium]
MANRIIPTEEKVNIMRQCLTLESVREAAIAHGISRGAIYYWFNPPALLFLVPIRRIWPRPYPYSWPLAPQNRCASPSPFGLDTSTEMML